jgi:glutamine amidotransferase
LRKKIAIVDYGNGNLFSISNALNSLGIDHIIARHSSELEQVGKIIMPGVGAFGQCMAEIKKRKLDTAIRSHIKSGQPLLGICVGMQILFSNSIEFGLHEGLNLIRGNVLSIKAELDSKNINGKTPNIGWYSLNFESKIKSDLFRNISQVEKFYFIHSYFGSPVKKSCKIAHIMYKNLEVAAVVQSGNVYGVQFHPEKSGESGLKFLQNFANL